MPRPRRAGLAKNKLITDYSTDLSKMVKTFGSEQAVADEYSRMRSILRKRAERMAKAGETDNAFYRHWGDVHTAMPTVKELRSQPGGMSDMTRLMAKMAKTLQSPYASTVADLRKRRREQQKSFEETVLPDLPPETQEDYREHIKSDPEYYQKIRDRAGKIAQMMKAYGGSAYTPYQYWQMAMSASLKSGTARETRKAAISALADLLGEGSDRTAIGKQLSMDFDIYGNASAKRKAELEEQAAHSAYMKAREAYDTSHRKGRRRR